MVDGIHTMTEKLPVRRKIRLPEMAYRSKSVFFITAATHRKRAWFSAYPLLRDLTAKHICELSADHYTSIFAWCIMPDHIHLLIQCEDVIKSMRWLKGRLTPIARQVNPNQRLWQRSFYDRALRHEEDLIETACYIWENPVRAGIVDNPGDYEWSGSNMWPNWRRYYRRG
jgi:REP element-mobilizing transposase RayT